MGTPDCGRLAPEFTLKLARSSPSEEEMRLLVVEAACGTRLGALTHVVEELNAFLSPPEDRRLATAVRRDLKALVPSLVDEFLNCEKVHFLAKRMRAREAMAAAAFAGNVEMLEMLYTTFGCLIDSEVLIDAVQGGHFASFDWVRNRLNGVRGHEPKYSTDELRSLYSGQLVVIAAKSGHADVTLALVRERYNRAIMDPNDGWLAYRVALRCRHYDIVELLNAEFPHPPSWMVEDEIHTNQNGGDDLFVYELRRNICEACTPSNTFLDNLYFHCSARLMVHAAAAGRLDLVMWFFENREDHILSINTPDAIDRAATNGHLHVVQWLHSHCSQVCSTAAMDGAAANNHLEIVRFLHENRNEGCTTNALDGAIANGHIQVVKYLLDYRTEGCTSKALDDAASNGHLEVAQLLHSRRAAVFTSKALDGAAANGHLAVVKWLLFGDYGSDGTDNCRAILESSPATMDQAAINGHLAIAELIDGSTRTHKKNRDCTGAALIGAVANQHNDVVRWLLDRKPEVCFGDVPIETTKAASTTLNDRFQSSIEVATERAAAAGYLGMVQLLHDYEFFKTKMSTRCRQEALCRVMQTAASTGRIAVVEWAYQTLDTVDTCLCHDLPDSCILSKNQVLVIALNAAVQSSQMNVTEWVNSKGGWNRDRVIKNSAFDKGFVFAAQKADFAMLEWICARYEPKAAWLQLGASAAAYRDHLEVLQWLSIQEYSQAATVLSPGDTPWGRLTCMTQSRTTSSTKKWLRWFENECGPVYLDDILS